MMSSPKAKTKKKPPKDSMTLLPCFYFIELPIVLSSLVSLYFMELTDLLSPATPGFHCYDRGLSLPYQETGDELIPLLMLLSLAFAGPAASIMLGEGLVYCYQSRVKQSKAEGSIIAGGCNFNSFLRRTVRFVGQPPGSAMQEWASSQGVLCRLSVFGLRYAGLLCLRGAGSVQCALCLRSAHAGRMWALSPRERCKWYAPDLQCSPKLGSTCVCTLEGPG
uniref:phospholipid phosphatase-related protein type 3-like n=1 Tax=Oncorhynchus gorbuscha TaxID=8017 RepID=UPI001EAF6D85|nr:phospholipid phosphatase-related protein type 3-like [Oncorhynchus gorbuscha]